MQILLIARLATLSPPSSVSPKEPSTATPSLPARFKPPARSSANKPRSTYSRAPSPRISPVRRLSKVGLVPSSGIIPDGFALQWSYARRPLFPSEPTVGVSRACSARGLDDSRRVPRRYLGEQS